MSGVDVNRLRNWARGYQRLMLGGLGAEAHTVGVDEFADDEGNYPYITAEDVLALLDERDALAAKVERVEALADKWADFDHDAATCPKFDCGDCTMLNAIFDIRAELRDQP